MLALCNVILKHFCTLVEQLRVFQYLLRVGKLCYIDTGVRLQIFKPHHVLTNLSGFFVAARDGSVHHVTPRRTVTCLELCCKIAQGSIVVVAFLFL